MKIHEIISEGIVGRTLGALVKNPRAQNYASDIASKVVGKLGHNVKDAGGVANAYRSLGQRVAKPVSVMANLTGKIGWTLKWFGIYQMFQDYNKAIKQGQANLKSGKWTQEEYENDVKQQKAILVAQLAIALPGFLLLKISTSWSLWAIGFKYSQNPFIKALGATMASMAVNTQAALIQLLRTDTATNMYAELIAGWGIGDISQELYDKVAKLYKQAEAKATGQSSPEAEPTPGSQADKNATSNTPNVTPTSGTKLTVPTGDATQDVMDKFKGIK
jgi:hypothetical protein